jgi:hypothetical protein
MVEPSGPSPPGLQRSQPFGRYRLTALRVWAMIIPGQKLGLYVIDLRLKMVQVNDKKRERLILCFRLVENILMSFSKTRLRKRIPKSTRSVSESSSATFLVLKVMRKHQRRGGVENVKAQILMDVESLKMILQRGRAMS